jgi:hypothetical protein
MYDWASSKAWVTAPAWIRQTDAMLAASGVCGVNVEPYWVSPLGTEVIVGRAPLNK